MSFVFAKSWKLYFKAIRNNYDEGGTRRPWTGESPIIIYGGLSGLYYKITDWLYFKYLTIKNKSRLK